MSAVFLQRKNTHFLKVKMSQNNEVFFNERKPLWQARKFVKAAKSLLLSVLAFSSQALRPCLAQMKGFAVL